MTETQAKSGTAKNAAAGDDRPADAASETPARDTAAGNDPTGRAVMGRAPIKDDKPDAASEPEADRTATESDAGATGAASVPKFTRAPGMPPPPDVLLPSQSEKAENEPAGAGNPTVARASVRGAASVGRGSPLTTQPIGVTGAGMPTVPGAGGPGGSGPAGPGGPAGRVGEAIRSARATVTAAASRGPRRARLFLKRVDPWSVMKFSFAVSFVLFIVVLVATAVLYIALDSMGVVGSVNKALSEMVGATGGDSKNTFRITAKGIIVGSALLGLVNVVLFTALATLSAFIYNVCSDLVGGIELTLAEKE